MRSHLIVAVAEDMTIGDRGSIPWSEPADLKQFKALTMNHTLVMGRRTYESIGRPLPGRKTIVLSSTPVDHEEIITCTSMLEARNKARALGRDLFFCGGKRVYEECINVIDVAHVTLVSGKPDGDTKFDLEALLPPKEWHVIGQRELSDSAYYMRMVRTMKWR